MENGIGAKKNSLLKNILFKKNIHLYVSVIIKKRRPIKGFEEPDFRNIHGGE